MSLGTLMADAISKDGAVRDLELRRNFERTELQPFFDEVTGYLEAARDYLNDKYDTPVYREGTGAKGLSALRLERNEHDVYLKIDVDSGTCAGKNGAVYHTDKRFISFQATPNAYGRDPGAPSWDAPVDVEWRAYATSDNVRDNPRIHRENDYLGTVQDCRQKFIEAMKSVFTPAEILEIHQRAVQKIDVFKGLDYSI